MAVSNDFEKWGLGYSGCDGGDIGEANNRTIWVCGIEWGGGHDPESLKRHIKDDVSCPPYGYESWNENISYIFNWQVMKLLSVINGGKVEDYKKFAKEKQPFVRRSKGYFKMNLYPIGFKDTANYRWHEDFSEITGFNTKEEYIKWCKEKRFQEIRKWATERKPEMIICLGKTYKEDFCSAFFDPDKSVKSETIDDHEVAWGINADNSLMIILPFMVNRYGLVKNSSIQKVGERIAEIRLLTNGSS